MVYLIYHSSDFDGACSGFVSRKYFEDQGKIKDKDFKMVAMNYGEKFDLPINKEDTIIMMDFTLPTEDLVKLSKSVSKFLLIDHHASAYKELKDKLNEKDYVYEEGKAACQLTWEFFFGKDVPYFIQLLSDYDVWNNKDENHWDEEIIPFQYGMRSIETDPKNDKDFKFWLSLLEDKEKIKQISTIGKNVFKYQEITNKFIAVGAYDLALDGLKCICVNSSIIGSGVFDSVWDENKYDAMLLWRYTKGQWSVSAYTTKDIDLPSKFTSLKFRGHKQACGCQVSTQVMQTLGLFK